MRKTEITILKLNYIVNWKERRGAHLDKLILCPLKLCITKDIVCFLFVKFVKEKVRFT